MRIEMSDECIGCQFSWVCPGGGCSDEKIKTNCYAEIEKEVFKIESESYKMLHFRELSESSTKKTIIEALARDCNWIEDHANEVVRSLDRLIGKIAIGKYS